MSEEKEEQETTWGLVVESDEIYSAKTNRWYPVTQTVSHGAGQVKVQATGIPKAIIKPVGDPVRVRRGATGKVVDMFAIIFSGETRRKVQE